MKTLIIDGNSIINRAFYGIRLLTAPDGSYTNAVLGFLNTYFKVLSEEEPDGVCVCFDLPKPTFRNKLFDEYKAGRHATPDELRPQIPLLKELLDMLGIKRAELAGYEADDLLGTISKKCAESGGEAVILTGDRDSMQLAGENVKVKIASTKAGQPIMTDYDPMRISIDYGVEPVQLIEVKALMGDKSDNIPGVAGVGEKTALALVAEYGSVAKLYDTLAEASLSPTLRTKLEKGRESAFLSLALAKIDREVPIDIDLDDLAPEIPDNAALYCKLEALGLSSVINRLGLAAPAKEVRKVEVITPPERKALTADTRLSGTSAFCAEYSEGVPVSIAVYDGENLYSASESDTGAEKFKKVIEAYLHTPGKKLTHDLKTALRAFQCAGIKIDEETEFFDSFLAAYLLNLPEELRKLCESELAISLPEDEEPSFIGNTESNLPGAEAMAVFMLAPKLAEMLSKQSLTKLYYEIELPLAGVLADMEYRGFRVEGDMLRDYGELLATQAAELEGSIYNLAGGAFNINSPKQLGEVLFEKLGLPAGRKTKSGYSTDADVLKKLVKKNHIAGLILEYRTLTKLKSTYADGLRKVISPVDGRVHSNFYQTGTMTGRISSSDPNLQNIPVRTQLGREMRRMFTAEEGYLLVDADYSQIELRLLAHISGDEAMKRAFREGFDIHSNTAAQVFGVPPEQVTSEMRSRAKAVNFGIVYGISDFALSEDINVSRREAREYIDRYLEGYPSVKKYMEEIVEKTREKGYVETIFGRKRYIPDINAKNFHLRSAAERIALNTPIQGSAADIIKYAMVLLSERLRREKLDARLILQIHDELIVEAKEEIADEVREILKYEMENAVKLSVALTADCHIGKNWLDAK